MILKILAIPVNHYYHRIGFLHILHERQHNKYPATEGLRRKSETILKHSNSLLFCFHISRRTSTVAWILQNREKNTL